ncbi:UDP-N-acetylmuramyl pentapeptide phosphotransferase [Falsibacillus pallidus]|uniref:UDP-GlcNAc:undecaprenyl-phosphate GlcNAc-1-phosphate transferase n=1 Tax=Falsibacillus pallidus TaxID=493781 RepID=A0A370GPU0_9BACI|nr:UDP-N-acetylmuramyl pentapeptide phosphotransferase [Falsibacillus pallidus]RDI45748.1 UDP-GlcNAc:undecaprenyl-phosphate GlcNAc-1-phosphate transferase [Falsibacillus pallidus]
MLYTALLIDIVAIVITGKLFQASKSTRVFEVISQIFAALIVIMMGKLEVSYINLGNLNLIELGYLTIPFTLLLLISLSNVMNVEKVQNNSILLLPFVSFICFSLSAFFTGDPFVLNTGICACLTIIMILLLGYFSGKVIVGRTLTTLIGFVIAVLSTSLILASMAAIYIPIFTLALPLTVHNYLQDILPSKQSTTVSSLTAMLFGVLLFIIPSNFLWILLVGFMILLAIMQIPRKYRFI